MHAFFIIIKLVCFLPLLHCSLAPGCKTNSSSRFVSVVIAACRTHGVPSSLLIKRFLFVPLLYDQVSHAGCSSNWTFSFSDNTAGILTRRSSYSRLHQSVYLVPVVITDGDYPMQSSTGTLTVRVCTCDREGNMELCNAEALSSSPGLSTGALIAILLCAIILLSKYKKYTMSGCTSIPTTVLILAHIVSPMPNVLTLEECIDTALSLSIT